MDTRFALESLVAGPAVAGVVWFPKVAPMEIGANARKNAKAYGEGEYNGVHRGLTQVWSGGFKRRKLV